MELALVAYLISILPGIKGAMMFFAYLTGIFGAIVIIYCALEEKWNKKLIAWIAPIFWSLPSLMVPFLKKRMLTLSLVPI